MTLHEWLAHSNFTLSLSSSFFGFYSHCGVMAALEERGLKPHKLTGSSAGALIAGAVSSGLLVKDIKELIFSIQRNDFWDPSFGFGLLRGQKFLDLLNQHYVKNFADTKIKLEVAALNLSTFKTEYLKAGSLPLAVAASCAVPVMFHPVKIGNTYYYDGGVFDKAAIKPEHADERILGVYFDSPGWGGVYERRKIIHKMSSQQKMLHFTHLPKVNFYNLSGRDEAFKAGYMRARLALDAEMTSSSIKA